MALTWQSDLKTTPPADNKLPSLIVKITLKVGHGQVLVYNELIIFTYDYLVCFSTDLIQIEKQNMMALKRMYINVKYSN